MKIAFSTLACPNWDWDTILVNAKQFGYDAIELRGLEKELFAPRMTVFQPDKIDSTLEQLHNAHLKISCLSSQVLLYDEANTDYQLEKGERYIDLAARLGVPYLRVLGDSQVAANKHLDINTELVERNLKTLGQYAATKNVTVLLETNGVFHYTLTMKKLMEHINLPSVGVLWDVHHTYRHGNEDIVDTYAQLQKYIKYIHLKDSVIKDGKVEYILTGEGDIPIQQTLLMLNKEHFSGYISLEWIKRWMKKLSEPEIILPHFTEYVKEVLKS